VFITLFEVLGVEVWMSQCCVVFVIYT